ncbi:hypothetical protein ACFSAG_14125 [Sphingorhabdus buctiana]|uniref:Uncharacterized protein n=1 Tax=Sphingorhabdus buctiana TaxID=1508805 RepID=A0ABW4MHX8_9SPHN
METTNQPTPEQQAFAALLEAYKAERHHLMVEADTEEAGDASVQRLSRIEAEMWKTAAPDLMAVLVKFEIANDDTELPPPEATASILADLRRLSGATVSPIFQPDLWLHEWETQGGSYLVRDGEALVCGDPTNSRHRSLTRRMEAANGGAAVKAMVRQCCKGLEAEVEA